MTRPAGGAPGPRGWPREAAGAAALVAGVALLSGPDPAPRARGSAPARSRPEIEDAWDPASGRGEVVVRRADGATVTLRLHERFPGYTGGLLLGSQDRSSWSLERPGAPPAGLWCAQDETLVLHGPDGARALFAHGWSEGLGRGAGGLPLRYLGGARLAHDREGLLLAARNATPPLAVTRWALVLPDGTLLTRARLEPTGGEEVVVSWWTGDDPWVGAYGSSEGDVAWSADDGLVRVERALDPAVAARGLGIADLPPAAGGGAAAPTLANFLRLGPGCPRPDHVLVADGFARDPAEVAAGRPLGARGSVALHLGWVARRVSAAAPLELTWAQGEAVLEGGRPRPRDVPAAAWRRLGAAAPPPARPEVPALAFAWEEVTLTVAASGDAVEVDGRYGLRPPPGARLVRTIWFPFAVDGAHPPPDEVSVERSRDAAASAGDGDAPAPGDGARAPPRWEPVPFDRTREGVAFPLEVAGREVVLRVRYRQRSLDASATYVLTSALAWPDPIGRATLRVRLPAGLDLAAASLPLAGPTAAPADGGPAGARAWTFEATRFRPGVDLTVRWRAAGR